MSGNMVQVNSTQIWQQQDKILKAPIIGYFTLALRRELAEKHPKEQSIIRMLISTSVTSQCQNLRFITIVHTTQSIDKTLIVGILSINQQQRIFVVNWGPISIEYGSCCMCRRCVHWCNGAGIRGSAVPHFSSTCCIFCIHRPLGFSLLLKQTPF